MTSGAALDDLRALRNSTLPVSAFASLILRWRE